MQINIIKFDLQAEEERINREKQLEQEERMAKELARINYERQREEKMRQYIKENRYTHLFHYLDLWYILGQYRNATPFAFVLSFSALVSSLLILTFNTLFSA